MKVKRGIIPIAIIAALLVSFLAPMAVSAQESQPVLPTAFYGDVSVNDTAAPVDTVITGRIVDAAGSPGEGTITVTTEGKYGVSSGLGSKLVVETDSLDDVDKEIEFYVKLPGWAEAQKADQTATYDSHTHQVNLTVTIVDNTPPTVTIDIPDYINAANEAAVPVTITSDEDGTYSYTISDGTVAHDVTGTGPITGGVDVDLTPDLSGLDEVSVTADASVEDAAGNTGDASTDTATKDTTAPTATLSPEDTDIDVAVDAAVTATFAEDVLEGAECDITITTDTTEVTGVLPTLNANTITIAHDDFALDTSYTVTIPDEAVEDLAGNPSAEITWGFTTVAVTFTITASAGANGSIEPLGDVVVSSGANQAFTITPDTGYEIEGVLVDDTSALADVSIVEGIGTYTFESVVAGHTISATFAPTGPVTYYTLTVTSDPTEGGSVTLDPSQPEEGYEANTSVELTATANEGYAFGSWSGDLSGSTNPDTITMDSEKSIVANFVELSAPTNVDVAAADPTVDSIDVTTKDLSEVDTSEMPAGITTQEAYVVEPTGTGSFTLVFSDVANASDIRVYKVVDGTWTLLDITRVDATTVEVTMDCADPILVFALPPATIGTATLSAGWNLLSTPILLDADSDTLGQIFGTDVENIEISYSWDAEIEDWDQLTNDYELLPLYGIYVKISSGASATAEFTPSWELSGPPSRELQPGLNLIGPAPALEEGAFPDTPLDEALVSIEVAGEFYGYCMVVSPAHNQPDWTYSLGGDIENLLTFNGYWVVMDNADTLFGFSTTP